MGIQKGEYLRAILQKKKITQVELVNKINESGLTNIKAQNINNILNGSRGLGVKVARIIEIVLKLNDGVLTTVVVVSDSERKKIIDEVNTKAKEMKLI